MHFKKVITISQVIMLILALGSSIYSYIGLAIGIGLGGHGYKPIVEPNYFIWLSSFIIMGLILKLILRQNNVILPIIGLMTFVALLIFTALLSENFTQSISGFDTIQYIIIILLPIVSVLRLQRLNA